MARTSFAKGIVYVAGKQLTMEQSVSITRTTGSQPVKTTALGYAGPSPGSAMLEISVSNAVPSPEFEMDPGSFMKDLKNASITIFMGAKSITVDAEIYEDTWEHSTDQEAKLSFKARAGFAEFE